MWDRAKGHQGEEYDEIEVCRIQQPPYSPELQPVERIFEYLRARIEGIVYGELEAKWRARGQKGSGGKGTSKAGCLSRDGSEPDLLGLD